MLAELKKAFANYNLSEIEAIALTSSTPDIIKRASRFDNRVSFIKASKEHFPNADALLIVGGEKFGLALFDKEGNYRTFLSNTSCAAGTGSFLDQQARRLNLDNINQFSELAFQNTGPKTGRSIIRIFSKGRKTFFANGE